MSNVQRLVVPLNYSRKAVDSIRKLAKIRADSGDIDVAKFLAGFGMLIDYGEKFLLPEDGRFAEKPELRQENLDLFKLPYPVTVIEFSVSRDYKIDKYHQVPVLKRVVLAYEITKDSQIFNEKTIRPAIGDNVWSIIEDRGAAMIWPIDYHSMIDEWIPSYCGIIVPYGKSLSVPNKNSQDTWKRLGWDTKKEGIECYPFMHSAFNKFANDIDAANILSDTNMEVVAAFELCTILNCKNIETEKITQDRLNKKRVAKNKSKLYDYHVLKVAKNKAASAKNRDKIVHDRKSPRTHMRRGHIRRTESGSVWVTNTIVNPGHGFIDKDYLVG